MNSSKYADTVLIDIEDRDSWDSLMKAFQKKRAPTFPCKTVEELFGRAEQSLKDDFLVPAEAQFRKALLSLAYCNEMDLPRKRELARTCADRLAKLRPRLNKEAVLQFSELRQDGIAHLYAFQIKHPSERKRLVQVIVDRETVHDGGEIFASAPDRQRKGLMERLPDRGASSSMRIPRNAPCPCGSGKKYKKCCSGKM